MTNTQMRMLAASIGLVAGALAAGTDNLNVNIGIAVVLLSGVIFAAEYVRSLREDRNS